MACFSAPSSTGDKSTTFFASPLLIPLLNHLLCPHPSTKLLSQLPDLQAARFSSCVSVIIFPEQRQHLAQLISLSCSVCFLLAPPCLHSRPSPITWPPCLILPLVLILEHHSRIQSLGLSLAQSLDDLSSPKDLKYESSLPCPVIAPTLYLTLLHLSTIYVPKKFIRDL